MAEQLYGASSHFQRML